MRVVEQPRVPAARLLVVKVEHRVRQGAVRPVQGCETQLHIAGLGGPPLAADKSKNDHRQCDDAAAAAVHNVHDDVLTHGPLVDAAIASTKHKVVLHHDRPELPQARAQVEKLSPVGMLAQLALEECQYRPQPFVSIPRKSAAEVVYVTAVAIEGSCLAFMCVGLAALLAHVQPLPRVALRLSAYRAALRPSDMCAMSIRTSATAEAHLVS